MHKKAKNMEAAARLARKYGVGAEIWRDIKSLNRHGAGTFAATIAIYDWASTPTNSPLCSHSRKRKNRR
jgi:hypothetical protein